MFLRALALQADGIEVSNAHEGAEETVAKIREAVAAYRTYEEGPSYPPLGTMTAEDAERITTEETDMWNAFHDMLKDEARGWWD
jgi:hypothetical protein